MPRVVIPGAEEEEIEVVFHALDVADQRGTPWALAVEPGEFVGNRMRHDQTRRPIASRSRPVSRAQTRKRRTVMRFSVSSPAGHSFFQVM